MIPSAARVRNHTRVIGPNSEAIWCVPRDWIMNSATRITADMGSTHECMDALTPGASFRPSMAPITEMAGVIMPSPRNRAAPQMPRKKGIIACRPRVLRARAIRASVPPSPLLSARIRKMTYLIVTIRVRAQSTRDTTPSTDSSTLVVPLAWCSASRMAYSGLVPMSPNTTPTAPSARVSEALAVGVVAVLGGTVRAAPVGGRDVRSIVRGARVGSFRRTF